MLTRLSRNTIETALAVCLGVMLGPAAARAYEPVPVLQAADLLPVKLRQSIHHRVLDEVTVEDGYFVFRVESAGHLYRVQSLRLLEIRVHELQNVAAARSQLQDEEVPAFDAVPGRRGVGSDSVMDILTDPVGTAGRLASNLSNNLEETVSGEYLDAPRTPTRPTAAAYDAPGPYKRSVAAQLYLDVYSTNPVVQQFLDTLAAARSAGRIREATATVSAPPSGRAFAGEAAAQARLEVLIKNNEPAKLRRINQARLEALGVTPAAIQAFLDNPTISPRRQSVICDYLGRLHGVENPGAVIELAAESVSEVDALAYQGLLEMLLHYQRREPALARLESGNALVTAVGEDGRLVYFLPLDYMAWTADTDRVLDYLARRADAGGHAQRELVLSGQISAAVRDGLAARGIGVRERFLF